MHIAVVRCQHPERGDKTPLRLFLPHSIDCADTLAGQFQPAPELLFGKHDVRRVIRDPAPPQDLALIVQDEVVRGLEEARRL